MTAEGLDPPLLFIEIAPNLAVAAEFIVDRLLEEERWMEDRRHEHAPGSQPWTEYGEIRKVHEDHQGDDNVVVAVDAIAEVDLAEVDLRVPRTRDLQELTTAIDSVDKSTAGTKPVGEPSMTAAKIEDPLVRDVAQVSIKEVVEPVDLRLLCIPACHLIPSGEVVISGVAHVDRVCTPPSDAATEFRSRRADNARSALGMWAHC